MRRLIHSQSREMEEAPERGRTHRRWPGRWLAAAIAAALLTGTAAGYALRGGELVRRLFEESGWAARYGDAADTEQLLDLGGALSSTVVEGDGLRLELLDAVSDGQFAMAYARLTVLDRAFLEQMETPGDLSFREWEMREEELPMACGMSIRSWVGCPELKEGQYRVIFSVNDSALAEGGQYEIRVKDACCWKGAAELPGEWKLTVIFQPAAVRNGKPGQICRIAGQTWELKRMAASPLALNLELHSEKPGRDFRPGDFEDLTVRLDGGEEIRCADCVLGVTQGDTELRLSLEFQMPVNVDRIEGVFFGEEGLYLEEK